MGGYYYGTGPYFEQKARRYSKRAQRDENLIASLNALFGLMQTGTQARRGQERRLDDDLYARRLAGVPQPDEMLQGDGSVGTGTNEGTVGPGAGTAAAPAQPQGFFDRLLGSLTFGSYMPGYEPRLTPEREMSLAQETRARRAEAQGTIERGREEQDRVSDRAYRTAMMRQGEAQETRLSESDKAERAFKERGYWTDLAKDVGTGMLNVAKTGADVTRAGASALNARTRADVLARAGTVTPVDAAKLAKSYAAEVEKYDSELAGMQGRKMSQESIAGVGSGDEEAYNKEVARLMDARADAVARYEAYAQRAGGGGGDGMAAPVLSEAAQAFKAAPSLDTFERLFETDQAAAYAVLQALRATGKELEDATDADLAAAARSLK